MNKIKSKAFVALLVVAMLVAQTVLPSFAADTAAENMYECNGKVVHAKSVCLFLTVLIR